MQDVIELLLQKKADLNAERESKIAEAVKAVENEFADRSVKIDALLDMAGYVPPVEEPAEVETVEEATAETPAEAGGLTAY